MDGKPKLKAWLLGITGTVLIVGLLFLPVNCMIRLDLDESLFLAAQQGNVADMQRLIAAGANVNARFDGSTPVLVAAVGSGKYEATKFLLDRGANPEVIGEIDQATIAQIFHDQPRIKRLLAHYRRPSQSDGQK
ncbi:ankyrin repeat domain-containing protein [bacterium]|nr:MAG: ankyrin repeat domain-containing protein [bacterium]